MEMDGIQNRGINTTRYTTDNLKQAENDAKTKEKKTSTTDNGVIKADGLNIPGMKDSVLKQLLAQRAALKVQMDQFKKDNKEAGVIQEHIDKKTSLQEEADSSLSEVNRLNGLKDDLQESYGVEEGSTEQKDLLLLEKLAEGKPMTEDEITKIKDMGPLTEYQKASLDYTIMEVEFQNRISSANDDIYNENRTISAIKQELLKNDGMIDANKEVEDLLKKVDSEIQKALLDEIKNRVNENLDIDPNTSILDNPQALLDQKKATEEDLKGLAVDEKV